jgi:hypothetical protein
MSLGARRRRDAPSLPANAWSGPRSTPSTAITGWLAPGAAAAVGALLWWLWHLAGLPSGAARPGFTGRAPDPQAWRWLVCAWLPVGFAAFGAVHGWLARRRPGLSRYLWWDAATWLAFVPLTVLIARWRSVPAWEQWLQVGYPLIVAGKAAILVRALHAGWAVGPDAERSPRALAARVFVTSAIVYVLTSAYLGLVLSTTGDEPYYLLITHSLLHDHDLDLANNLAQQEYWPFYWGRLAQTQGLVHQASGRVYSFSYSGLLAYLLLPGYALGGRLGAMIVVSLCGAALAANLFLLARDVSGSLRVGFLTWLYLGFSPPVFLFVSQIYPEIPAAALVAWAVRVIRRLPARTPTTLPGLAVALIGLVLLKGRYAVLAVPLLIWTLARLRRPRLVLAGLAVSGLAAAGLWAIDQHFGGLIYRLHYQVAGLPNPRRPAEMGGALLGLLADQEFGLLPSAPVYVLALVGIPVALRRDPHTPALLAVLALAVAPLLGPYWFAGFSSPARYLVVAVPLLAVFVAWTLSLDRPRWLQAFALASWWGSLALSLILTVRPLFRYNRGTGETRWMSAAAARAGLDLPRFLPSLFSPSPESRWVLLGLAVMLAAGAIAAWRATCQPEALQPGLPAHAAPLGAVAIIAGAALALTLAALSVPTSRVKAETMASEGRGARFEGSEAVPVRMWVMQSPGRLSKIVRLAPGPLVLRIFAGGYSTDNEAARLSVWLDGHEVGAVSVATGDHEWHFGSYDIPAVAAGGRHVLRLECPNAVDDRRHGKGRYLGVDRVEIHRVR